MYPTPGGWFPPNLGATNSSGFTALPGGTRDSYGDFKYMRATGFWWSSPVSSGSNAWNRALNCRLSYIGRYNNARALGFSVRCVRD